MSVLKSEITDRDIPSVDKFTKVLKYLNTGRELEIDGMTFKVAEHIGGDCFGIVQISKMTNSIDDKVEEIVLGVPMEFFIKKCYMLKDNDFFIMAANIALTEINKRR